MTSKQTKEARAKDSALKRAKAMAGINTYDKNLDPPPGAAMADHDELVHNNTYGLLPCYYVDKVVVCRSCGREEVWTAENQKWWYEEAKGNIHAEAVHCRACRDKEKARKDQARKNHLEKLSKKNGA